MNSPITNCVWDMDLYCVWINCYYPDGVKERDEWVGPCCMQSIATTTTTTTTIQASMAALQSCDGLDTYAQFPSCLTQHNVFLIQRNNRNTHAAVTKQPAPEDSQVLSLLIEHT